MNKLKRSLSGFLLSALLVLISAHSNAITNIGCIFDVNWSYSADAGEYVCSIIINETFIVPDVHEVRATAKLAGDIYYGANYIGAYSLDSPSTTAYPGPGGPPPLLVNIRLDSKVYASKYFDSPNNTLKVTYDEICDSGRFFYREGTDPWVEYFGGSNATETCSVYTVP